jgi:hypothetical protein
VEGEVKDRRKPRRAQRPRRNIRISSRSLRPSRFVFRLPTLLEFDVGSKFDPARDAGTGAGYLLEVESLNAQASYAERGEIDRRSSGLIEADSACDRIRQLSTSCNGAGSPCLRRRGPSRARDLERDRNALSTVRKLGGSFPPAYLPMGSSAPPSP